MTSNTLIILGLLTLLIILFVVYHVLHRRDMIEHTRLEVKKGENDAA